MVKTKTAELPEDLLTPPQKSRPGSYLCGRQVRMAPAIPLFQQGVISTGRAAELA